MAIALLTPAPHSFPSAAPCSTLVALGPGLQLAAVTSTSQSQEQLSELEKSMDVIIDVFHQYSRREGDRDTLSKAELKLLIEKQLANYLRHVKNKATIDEIMKDLDINKDEQISFCEMMLLVTRVTIATHDHLHEVEDQQHQHKHQHHH
ncbi:protein MRP-126-like [Aegotheles albertisi]